MAEKQKTCSGFYVKDIENIIPDDIWDKLQEEGHLFSAVPKEEYEKIKEEMQKKN